MTESQSADIRMVYGNDVGTFIIEETIKILNRVLDENNEKITLRTRNNKGDILNKNNDKYFVLSTQGETQTEILIGILESKDSKIKYPVVRISNNNPIFTNIPARSSFPSNQIEKCNVILNGDTISSLEQLLNAEISLCYGETQELTANLPGLIVKDDKKMSRRSEAKGKQINNEKINKGNDDSGFFFMLFGIFVALVGLFINAGVVIIGVIIFLIGGFMLPTPENVNSSPPPDFKYLKKSILGTDNTDFNNLVHGYLNSKLYCRHCKTRGRVWTKKVRGYRKKTERYCDNCESKWYV